MKSPKRVTLTVPILDGGIGRNLINLSTSWLRSGVSVDLVVDQEDGPYLELLPSEVRIFQSGGSHPISGVPWLAAYLRRRRPLGILVPVPRHVAWALRARRLARIPLNIVANVHTNYEMEVRRLGTKKRQRRITQLTRNYPRCDAIVPVSQGAAAAFSKLTGISQRQLITIPNPVVSTSLLQDAKEEVDHPWFKDAIPIIIWAGRLSPEKNVELLIEAFEMVRATRPCRLVLIGSGPEKETLQQRVASSEFQQDIAFLGHQNNPHRFIRRAAVLALSSHHEGLGNILIEAMALGTPVVSVNCPSGPAEILEDGYWGPLVPTGDMTAFAKGLQKCLDEPLPLATLQAAAARYSVDPIATRYLELLCPAAPLKPAAQL